MTRFILDENGKPWFAVQVDDDTSPLRGVADTAANAAESLADVGDVIAKSCSDILGAMRDGLGDLAPEEIELQFGVSLRGDVGISLVTKASGEATFTVRVCWKPNA
ncbi:CU044_2847 family protein [Microbacterium ureisolvens]|uniref:Trypsin-co-occurring domain-containing protein n=1 Tax=Microbacterium ureisolvens TaxID=2781186 RepID=A0ABS7HZW9_9MICO|nr:CU044_2847 family protein [Microbacterium ureisolvens]MBW9110146.1 hypothetical protein [Microbacterium ureisolvens]